MLVIVWGHVAGFRALVILPPFYVKQLGVCFFVFLTGFTMATERRGSAEVLFRRLFEVYLIGAAAAVVLSVATVITIGTWQRSNYLPFLGGVNVLMDAFPANPTTWYLGAYLHLLLVAAVTRRARVGMTAVGACAALEVVYRALLMTTGRLYTTYMLWPNWATCLFLGIALSRETPRQPKRALIGGLIVIMAALVVRPATLPTFPLQTPAQLTWLNLLRDSAAVTGLYAGVTAAIYGFFAGFEIRTVPFVDAIADHTLLIFIIHMPLFYVLPAALKAPHESYVFAVARTLICLILPLLVSMIVHQAIDLNALRDSTWRALQRRLNLGAM
jgi:hypothetical protein